MPNDVNLGQQHLISLMSNQPITYTMNCLAQMFSIFLHPLSVDDGLIVAELAL